MQGIEAHAEKQKYIFVMTMTAMQPVRTINMKNKNSLDYIIGFEALYRSMLKCKKGVLWKDSTASFYLNGAEKIINLSKDLEEGTYKPRPTVNFTITSPKRREIASVSFRDRVYQRSLNDNAVYPIMSKSFIYDNFACQKKKGTDAARKRLKDFLHRYYRKHGHNGYVAQFDIHGYYPNMPHEIAEKTFEEKLPPDIYKMVIKILRQQYKGDYGYNPGSQLIQIAGISVLDKFDHYVKEKLHAKYYERYMDDFLIISNNKDYLEDCVEKATIYLENMGFEINKKKTRIFPLQDGIEFLGFIFKLTDSGKVLMHLKQESIIREKKKLRRLIAKSKKGFLPKNKVDESYAAWRNHASKGNTYKLIIWMDAYYKKLWGENNGDNQSNYDEFKRKGST